MKIWSRFAAVVGSLCLAVSAVAQSAASLLDDVQLVLDANAALNPVVPAQTFTITAGGSYVVTLTDLQLPAALATLSLAIADSTSTLVSLSAAGTKTVTLPAGTYTAELIASAAQGQPGGVFSVQLAPAAGGAVVWQYSDAVGASNPAPTTGQSVLSDKFTAGSAGAYQLTVADLQFPVALNALQLIILNDCGTTAGCVSAPVATLTGPAISSTVNLPMAGTYDLFINATANSNASGTPMGLYSVQIAGGGAVSAVYGNTVAVGQLPAPAAIPITAAGTISMQLTDLAQPAALASLQSVATQGGSVLGQLTQAGTLSLPVAAGTLQLYVIGQAGGATGQGSYAAYLTTGAQVVADVAQPVLSMGSFGYSFPVSLSAAGTYQLGVYDFQLPTAFSSLTSVVAQAGAVVSAPGSSGGSSLVTGAQGTANILVFPVMSSSTASGLFGVQLTGPGSSGPLVYENTQGVGALFSSQTFTVTTAGNYDLTLTDLGSSDSTQGFPQKLGSLAVIATRGEALAGQIVGSNTLTISATPGTYVLNVFAQVAGNGVDYGLYGVNVQPSASVMLMASADQVASGGTVNLTWSTSNATGCSASASPSNSGWTGAIATSGTQATAALTGDTIFSISCTGQSGSTVNATATVKLKAAAAGGGSHSGGGALTAQTLLWLLLILVVQVARRRGWQS